MKKATNPDINQRTKHIMAHYHFTSKRIISIDIHLQFVSSIEQNTDFFTKPLGISLFQ
uniref:Uncharacterized protein n=1 Tax=Physcomitrium patens TaxID=3218 RepID=A0A2K1L386_PHYPA|nr:hypothetical protein PHYPA_003283 [Physcomitrium patens]